MSAKARINDAQLCDGMQSLRNCHIGDVPCYRDKKAHAKWRWGIKKGTRRARRRISKEIIDQSISGLSVWWNRYTRQT